MKKRRLFGVLLPLAIVAVAGAYASRQRTWRVAVSPTLEDRLADGSLYNPNTQSFLRENHWLDEVTDASITANAAGVADISLHDPKQGHDLTIRNLPLHWLVPRLHYHPASPPDRFDAFNLMLAEFSRNSLAVPVGQSSDSMAHFETDLDEAVPWTLDGDYGFVPNPNTRPVRLAVVNNCLRRGLWEFTASDRTGEIYHAWFDMPEPLYLKLMANANGVDSAFASAAVQWQTEPVPLRLERLRKVEKHLGQTVLSVVEHLPVGFSSQDSRRKLHRRFVEVEMDGRWTSPTLVDDLTAGRCRFSNFIEPGKYSTTNRKEFDLRFLRRVQSVDVARVTPLTHYDWRHARKHQPTAQDMPACIELTLNLSDHRIVIGNLPIALLVPQEDLVINGFGVGVLASSGLAERRRYRIEEGPPPSFAYLCRMVDGRLVGLNSHDFGIEQIFIRTRNATDNPWWEITISSYERIVDIIKYRVTVPEELHREVQTAALEYVSPLYRTYRDDNLR